MHHKSPQSKTASVALNNGKANVNKQRYGLSQRGAGAVEYALIIAVVVLLVVGIAGVMRGGLAEYFGQSVECVDGFLKSGAACTGDSAAGGGSNGNGTSGDGTSGDGTSGDGTSGTGIIGDRTSGDRTSGDRTSGDRTSGDRTSGDRTSGNGISGNGTSGTGISGTGTSGNATVGGGISGGGVSRDGTNGGATIGGGISGGGTGGGRFSGGDINELGVSAVATIGDGTSADGTSADGTSADGTSADGTSADGTSADGTSGDGTSGDGTSGDGVDSNDTNGTGNDSDQANADGFSGGGADGQSIDNSGSFCDESCEPVASSGTGGTRPSQMVGNPINVTSGNKYQLEIDLTYPNLGLVWERHYNSQKAQEYSGIGNGWRIGYDTRLLEPAAIFSAQSPDSVTIHQGDGRKVGFNKDGERYKAQLPADGYLTLSDNELVWNISSGKVLRFDDSGSLASISSPGAPKQTLIHNDQGRLTEIVSQHGGALSLQWLGNQIASVTGPDGRVVKYSYDHLDNLVAIKPSDGQGRAYHYENTFHPHHLTGVTDQFGERFATYGYNGRGQAVLSQHAGDVGKISLYYGDGHTTVTNSLGLETKYYWEIKNQAAIVTKVEGAGCSQCGVSNVSYTYDDNLQLVSRSDVDGIETQYSWDEQNRLISVSEKNQDADVSKTILSFDYRQSEKSLPEIISKPSVIAGKQVLTELSYDDLGNVTNIVQRGWRPNGVSANSGSAEITRSTKLQWKDNLLLSVDGPRQDVEDVMRFTYDDRGLSYHHNFS